VSRIEVAWIIMRNILRIFPLFLFLSFPTFGQSSERPETIVIPASSLGDVSEVRKQILQNTLTDELKEHFRIVPQEKYEQVLEKVFQELEYEECSEDVCIMKVQEMLQVENVFHLQVIGEGSDTQLSLSWRNLDEKRNETDICSGCGTIELSGIVMGLIGKLVGVEEVIVEKPMVVRKIRRGILFKRKVNGVWGWFKDGDEKTNWRYVGEISRGFPNGYGSSTFSNGEKYEGFFKDGKRNGKGNLIFYDGTKYIGDFKDGEFWNGIEYDTSGKIIVKWVNGKYIKQ